MGEYKSSETYIKFLIYFVVVVLINLAGIKLFFRIDLTSNQVYSLSEASRKVVSTLSEPLTINVFFTKDLPAPYNGTEQYLRDLLEEYAIFANRKNHFFNYRIYDVSPQEEAMDDTAMENQKLANNYGIHPVQVRHIEKDAIGFKKAYMGLVLIHGDLIEKIPTILSTEGLEYNLTMSMQKLHNKVSSLVGLEDKVKIKLFMSSSIKVVAPFMGLDELPNVPREVKRVVDDLNGKLFNKLSYEYFDPTMNPAQIEDAKKYALTNLKWPDLQDGKVKAGDGTIGLVLEYGGKKTEVQLLNVFNMPIFGTRYELVDMENLGDMINGSIESLIDINETLGYLSDHGTPPMAGGMPRGMMPQQGGALSNFDGITSKSYSIKDVALSEGNIPDDLSCLIIAGPKETFTDYELYQIDQFLMKGKSLALFMDSFEEVSPQQQQFSFNQAPVFVPLDTGLEKLLAHYGVSINKSYVMDESCFKQPARTQTGGEQPIYFAPLVKNKFINDTLDFMKSIKGLVTMKASPLELNAERLKENKITADVLFSSSEKSWEMSGQINLNPMMIFPPQSDSEKHSMPLACLFEGEFPSYFDGKPIPEKIEKKSEQDTESEDKENSEKANPNPDMSKIEGKGVFIPKGQPGKIFLVGTSDMLKDSLLDPEGVSPNAVFIMNVIDHLNNRGDISELRSKEQQFNPLEETDSSIKMAIKLFNIGGLPVMVAIFGLFVFVIRKARRKRIQMMFQS
ncbi:MAG: Gldg family protein [Proteobacteria bacterium]|nr:Gldg family protein [Pseudomonadota bacterium]